MPHFWRLYFMIQKVQVKLKTRESSQLSHPAMSPGNHNINQQGMITNRVRSYMHSLVATNSFLVWLKTCWARGYHPWYWKSSQKPKASDIPNLRREPKTLLKHLNPQWSCKYLFLYPQVNVVLTPLSLRKLLFFQQREIIAREIYN